MSSIQRRAGAPVRPCASSPTSKTSPCFALVALVRELNVATPSAQAADEVLTKAGELGYEHRDIAGLYEVLGRMETVQTEAGA